MASSAVTWERRASVRRTGMQVLGKVPKPINLPSQRSENHGLDPNVEIVPKGTLSWGSRSSSSSSASNAWGSSTQSPNNEGGTSSPSHLSGRPSSGGSGTRPSTAGSDRAHESGASAWGPNSRPSSASGALTSNQMAGTSLRPRSAEPRPGSSQLSRFAEPLSDNSVAWVGAGTVEKLGGASSKKDGFSLASGDFPTLGSDKNNSVKDSQDHPHSRPGSSSRIAGPTRRDGDDAVNANLECERVNNWRRESSYVEDGEIQPGAEKWQVGPQPYPSASIPPQHFDPWHGTPMGGPPGGVWYRGPPGGPPYGSPVPHGGFPMEPFPFYRPQVPAAAIANPQPGHPSTAALRGHHPKNGDIYRPSMPEAYIRPGAPVRPGFYHGPVPYEGCYAPPPVGYCNPSERDIPYIGMAAGPPVYNSYASQNIPDPGNPHARFSGNGSTGKPLAAEQVGSVHPHDNRGPGKVILKQNNGLSGQDEQNWEHAVATSAPHLEKEDHTRSSWEHDWESDHKNAEDMNSRTATPGEELPSPTSDNQGKFSSGLRKQKLRESRVDAKTVDESSAKSLEIATSASSEVPQVLSVHPKDSALIQKIEGLNAKARASGGRCDASSVSHKEDRNVRLDRVNAKVNVPKTEASATAATGAANARRASTGMQGKADFRGKAMSNTQEVEGWPKQSPVINSLNVQIPLDAHVQDCHISTEANEKSLSHLQQKDEGESMTPMFDPSDGLAQRAKMRELARQKAKQLQKEEEERTKEQKAKALAKLEELNRRTQAAESFTKKSADDSSDDTVQLNQEPVNLMEPAADASKSGVLTAAPVPKPDVAQASDASMDVGEESAVLPRRLPLEMVKVALEEPVVTQNQSVPLQSEHINNTADAKTTQRVDESVSRQKRTGYKQKQFILSAKRPAEMPISTSITEAPRSHTVPVVDASAPAEVTNGEISSHSRSSLTIDPSFTAESSLHQKRKNNRGNKNKQKQEETSSMAALPAPVPNETRPTKAFIGTGNTEICESKPDPSASQIKTDYNDMIQSSEQQSLPGEEGHIRVNSQWKPQPSRRMPRNPLPVKEKLHSGDAVVWAPVRSQNKTEVAVEAGQKTTVETASASTKSDMQVQSSPKSKRAEMERYVPKPVAKELAQQGSSQQLAPPLTHMGSNEAIANTQPASSVVTMASSSVDARNGEGKQSKQGKTHGSWKQRVSAGSSPVEKFRDVSPSNLSKNVEIPSELTLPVKPEAHLLSEQPQYYNEWDPPDGWNIPPIPEAVASVTVPVVKDVGAMGRGKRHSFRGQSSTGSNPDFEHTNLNSREKDRACTQPPTLEESQGGGERSSHWQPKSQRYSNQNQWGSRPTGGHNVTEEFDKFKEPTFQQGKSMGENMNRANHGQTLSRTSITAEAPTEGPQGARRERKVDPAKARHHSPKRGPVKPVESASSATVDIQHEQRPFHRNGNQNSRFGRGYEPRGERSSAAAEDNRQLNPPVNRERRHNSHHEYQQVGPQNSNTGSEGQTDGSQQAIGSRARDKGQNHPRRGKLLWAPKSEG